MKVVGEQLQNWAQEQKEDLKKDMFGRSAFNRYYYAAYLETRKSLGELNPVWKNEKHRAMPNTLITTVRKPVIRELDKQVRKDIITKSERSKAVSSLKVATASLSDLLAEAYDLRCVADYEPEEPICIDNKLMSLKEYKLNSARDWPNKARAYCKTIRKIWRGAGLV